MSWVSGAGCRGLRRRRDYPKKQSTTHLLGSTRTRIMQRWQQNNPVLTREERRARRELRREKQRKDNIGRAAKMHAARRQMEAGHSEPSAFGLNTSVFVGCSGWF